MILLVLMYVLEYRQYAQIVQDLYCSLRQHDHIGSQTAVFGLSRDDMFHGVAKIVQ